MAKTRNRVIFHVDMDHFFTAVEEREHPEYTDNPVVVGADPRAGKGRGVVSTCNYEARKYGIRSAMPITRAWRRCPHAVYLPVNYDLYEKVSSRIMTILRRFAGKFEQWGLDEAFLDVTSKVHDLEEAKRLAQEIKRKIYAKEKLTCSIGIGSNKLVAKIASDFNKPDGLTVVEENDVKSFLSPLPVEKLLWVGKKTKRKLNALGIKTIGDLANFDASTLIDKFGVMGRQMHLSAKGIDRSEIQEQWEIKSMSRDTTFDEDTSDTKLLLKTLNALAEDVHKQLTESNFNFKTITIKIRYENFETHSHSKTLPFMTDRLVDIQKTVGNLMQVYLQPDRKVRLIGLKLSNLVSSEKQKKLI
ncbi:MAG: DNA polymerase IV [Candidatus Bathyarchaeota archaeon]|nr:DNA polymerase IV [Candidatus Bathyarchaeota archaeon]MDH5733592.1 DNA polymerase IV [Candidatus Bathyarchaeota archaeon]